MNKRQAKKRRKKIRNFNSEGMQLEELRKSLNAIKKQTPQIAEGFRKIAEGMDKALKDIGKKYGKPTTKTEEPAVVVARKLSERRKACGRREWKASKI